MDHKLTYDILTVPETDIRTVKGFLMLYGRNMVVTMTVYTIRRFEELATSVRFSMRPVDPKIDNFSSFDNGRLRLRCTLPGEFQSREVEQDLTIPQISGVMLEFSHLAESGEQGGRAVVDAVLRKMESLVESARQELRGRLSPRHYDIFAKAIRDRYETLTRQSLRTFLSGVNWKFLFCKSFGEEISDIDDRCINVIDYALQNNNFRFNRFDANPVPVSDLVAGLVYQNEVVEQRVRARIEEERARERARMEVYYEAIRSRTIAEREAARDRATSMLGEILGDKYAKQFADHGCLFVESHGYSFRIPGNNQWIECTDPHGTETLLCIHTLGMTCDPIDEMVFALLHIKHDFYNYMNKAVVQKNRDKFQKPEKPRR